ncbi:prolyl oligopeptidase family serine peptidase [Rathayibacter sp. ZW T2_19]|uniref:Prolyl oligopeptidase family serine peptidase n=1 Tax=Rathayibacter rubneri TaxID=2950106 RepID=A0A9X2E3S9_9MICO|nr:alpha/beta fold hydrolase [Rathayibacter rubneri]MCM6763846.1 prolyl oligopeptidase family serine peptidase [Rathayibacter rubneri]
MRLATAAALSAAALSAAVAGAAAAGVLLARRVVLPGRPRFVRLHSVTASAVVLDADSATARPGTFGLWSPERDGHLRIGAVLGHDARRARIRREVLASSGAPLRPGPVRWTGHVFSRPEELDPAVRTVLVPVPGGTAPAWVLPGSDVWFVHVHGIRTSRVTALRSVPVAQRLGATSIVPSFRGDGDGPDVPRGASTLGQTEWQDVDAALEYAVAHGASSLVLVGWSLGAQIALLLAERSAHRGRIAGLVLVSPATDWRGAIRHGARRVGLPVGAARLAEWALGDRILHRPAGLPVPIDLEALDWGAGERVAVPTLVLHSVGDPEVPFALTERFAAANPRTVEVVAFADAAHGGEYNLDPERFDRAVGEWAVRTIPTV